MNRVRRPSVFPLAVELSSTVSSALCTLLCVAMLILFGASPVRPQAPPDLAGAVHADLDRPPPYLSGSVATGRVTNDSSYRLTNVRLRLDASDAAGQPLAPTFGWVNGDVPARGRGWFRILVPLNAVTLSVSVVSFDLVSIESP